MMRWSAMCNSKLLEMYVLLLFAPLLLSTRCMEKVEGLAFAPNFISKVVESDLIAEKDSSYTITTRFPPEPNGYLHLGHAKAVCFNHEIARQSNGKFHMRLDDTNPTKEDVEYVQSILEDVRWILSSETNENPWDGPVRKTSSYFDLIYDCAMSLIETGDAYVDSLSSEQIREYRGTLKQPGVDSPFRTSRTLQENIAIFQQMRQGLFPNGAHVVRAKINMSSPNINLRDPVLYRILTDTPHPETGDTWKIYPMYDFSHPISDAVEGVTHSLCSLEFEDHRPLYDWTLQKLMGRGYIEEYRQRLGITNTVLPKQMEFSRLNLKYTVLSKRKLIHLVTYNYVNGWSDPRMPTLSGVRRRGIPPEAIHLFNERNGISKVDSVIDYSLLEDATREVMDKICPRAFCILQPLPLKIRNYLDQEEILCAPRHPSRENSDNRSIPFGPSIYIERDDFFDTQVDGKAPKGWKRLVPGGMVRLKYAYVIRCDDVIRDPTTNQPVELMCSYFPETRGGQPLSSDSSREQEDATKPTTKPGIIHWVEASTAVPCEVNLYDRLFAVEEPGKSTIVAAPTTIDDTTDSVKTDAENDDLIVSEEDEKEPSFLRDLNPNSLTVLTQCFVEPSVRDDALQMLKQMKTLLNQKSEPSQTATRSLYTSNLSYQFERNGYFALDETSNTDSNKLVFNRVVTLRDTWTSGTVTSASEGKERSRGVLSKAGGEDQQRQVADDEIRIALRSGTILSVEPHPTAPALVVCKVDCGDDSGPHVVVGKIPIDVVLSTKESGRNVIIVTNLKPAKLAGIESTAMLLAGVLSRKDAEDDDTPLEEDPAVELLTVPNNYEMVGTTLGSLLRFENCGMPQPDEMLKSKGALKVWDRLKASLKVNANGEVVYAKNGKECRMISTQGFPVTMEKIKNGVIQ